jgi:hypothetical protein
MWKVKTVQERLLSFIFVVSLAEFPIPASLEKKLSSVYSKYTAEP